MRKVCRGITQCTDSITCLPWTTLIFYVNLKKDNKKNDYLTWIYHRMATHYPAPTTEELQDVRFARVKRPSVDENSGEGQVSGPGYWFPKGEKNGNLISLREDEIEVCKLLADERGDCSDTPG